MTDRRWVLLCSLVLSLVPGLCGSGCGEDAVSGPAYDWTDPELPARLDEAMSLWTVDFGLYGAAVAVSTPGWFDWSGSAGEEDIETHTPYFPDTLGRLASATKPFTATLVLQLVDEGLLSLDTPLSAFVPNYPDGENITVDDLLRHRSGIPDVQLNDGFFMIDVLARSAHWFKPEQILRWTYLPFPMLDLHTGQLIPREPLCAPGAEYHYSQPGYTALGLIVEDVTGNELADVYDERIIMPLSLEDTYLARKGDPLYPAGYTNLFGLLPEKVPAKNLVRSANSVNSACWSAGGIISTAGELTRFLSALLDGRLYSQKALASAEDWMVEHPGTEDTSEYGMGLARRHYSTFTTIGHDGGFPSTASVMQYVPELDVFVGAVTNTDPTGNGVPNLVERVVRALRNEPQ